MYVLIKQRTGCESTFIFVSLARSVLGNATRAPKNPGKPADFQTHKPGFMCGKNPGFQGLTKIPDNN